MKKSFYLFVICLLLIFSYVFYIYIINYNNKSYTRGLDSAFDLIMKQANNPNCDTININNGTDEVVLINVKCLSGENVEFKK